MSMQIKFTKKALSLLKPKKKPYCVYDSAGSYLRARVGTTGVISLQFQKKINKKPVTKTLGQFRDKDGKLDLELGEAKKKARLLADSLEYAASQDDENFSLCEVKTFGEFVEEYPTLIAEQATVSETVDRIKKKFSHWNDIPLSEISPKMVKTWRRQRQSDGVSNATVNREMATLGGLFTQALSEELIAEHPVRGIQKFRIYENLRNADKRLDGKL